MSFYAQGSRQEEEGIRGGWGVVRKEGRAVTREMPAALVELIMASGS